MCTNSSEQLVEGEARPSPLGVAVDSDTGRVQLEDAATLLFDPVSWGAARDELIDTAGMEYAQRFLTRLGYVCGQTDAARARRSFPDKSLEDLILLGPTIHSQRGCAWVETIDLTMDSSQGTLLMSGHWRHSRIAEHHITSRGVSRNPVCWELAGYMTGYASEILGESILFIEDECVACEARSCHFCGRHTAGWGPLADSHLPC